MIEIVIVVLLFLSVVFGIDVRKLKKVATERLGQMYNQEKIILGVGDVFNNIVDIVSAKKLRKLEVKDKVLAEIVKLKEIIN